MDQVWTLIGQSGVSHLPWQAPVMWAMGGLFIFLAIKKDIEPLLLLPIGFTVIMMNIPLGGLMHRPDAVESLSSLPSQEELERQPSAPTHRANSPKKVLVNPCFRNSSLGVSTSA